MFEASHQTGAGILGKGGKLFFFSIVLCVCLDCLYTQKFPHWQRQRSHTQTKTQDAPTSLLGRRTTNGAELCNRGAPRLPRRTR